MIKNAINSESRIRMLNTGKKKKLVVILREISSFYIISMLVFNWKLLLCQEGLIFSNKTWFNLKSMFYVSLCLNIMSILNELRMIWLYLYSKIN